MTRARTREAGSGRGVGTLALSQFQGVTGGSPYDQYRSTVGVLGGRFTLPVSAEDRAGAGIQAGDVVDVTLQLNTEPREVIVPDALQAALGANAAAKQRFEALSYSRQRQHILAVERAKTAETRQRRIDGVITVGY